MKNYLPVFIFLAFPTSLFALNSSEEQERLEQCSAYPIALRSDVGNWSISPVLHFATPSLKALQKLLEASNHMPAARWAAHSAHMFKMIGTYYRHREHNHSLGNTTFVCDLVSDVAMFGSNYYQGIDRARSASLRFGSTTSSEIKKQKDKEKPHLIFSMQGLEYLRSWSLTVAELIYGVAYYFDFTPGLNAVLVFRTANNLFEALREAALQESFHLTRKMARSLAMSMIYGLQVRYRPNPALFGTLMASEYLSDAFLTYNSQ